jgi:hypothetical protein
MLITSVVICTFVRSSVIANNDLGWRGFLFAQFVLILWSVDFWPSWSKLERDAKITLLAMLILGVAGTVYQGIMLRIFPLLADRGVVAMHDTLSPDRQLGRRTMAMRRAYARLESILPETATIQFNPKETPNGYFAGMYSNRQVVAFDEGCGSVFGGSGRPATAISPNFTVFAFDSASPRRAGTIDVLVQDTDPVWADQQKPARCSRWSPMASSGHSRSWISLHRETD